MARITEKEVHQAARELDAQGVKPTTSKIREKLGSGSFSTIQNFLITYEGAESHETPETPEELEELLPVIWAKAWDISEKIFQKEKDALTARIKTLEEDNKCMELIIEKQDATLENLELKNQSQLESFEATIVEFDKLKEENAFLKGKLEAFEKVKKTQPKVKRPIKIEPEPAAEKNG